MSKKYQRRNRVSESFSIHLIEMLESPAWRALSLSARRLLDRLEIELGHHGGNDNGKLPVTKLDLVAYGISHDQIAPAIREVEALGFSKVTQRGRGGNAEHRQPNHFYLTYAHWRGGKSEPPTHDWRKVKTVEEAKEIARQARAACDPIAVKHGQRAAHKFKNRSRKPGPVPNLETRTETVKSPVPETRTTGQGRKPGPLSISGGGGAAASSTKTGPSRTEQPAPAPAPAPVTPKPAPSVNGNGSNGAEHGPIDIPVVKADAASLAAADATLSQWIAELNRLHSSRDLRPDDDERQRQLASAATALAEQIKVVRRMA